jgi:hypothetical protein
MYPDERVSGCFSAPSVAEADMRKAAQSAAAIRKNWVKRCK